MQYHELLEKNCKIAKEAVIQTSEENYIGFIEQECHLNIAKVGDNDKELPEVLVCCSYPRWITKLSKCKSLVIDSVLLSKNKLVLEIKGKMPINKVTIRK